MAEAARVAEIWRNPRYPWFDWQQPDYTRVFESRASMLVKLRADPGLLAAAKEHYRRHPWDFINDWGMTFDPRQLAAGRLASIPFVMFHRQVDYVQWLYDRWRAGEPGLVEKSRDMGATWLTVGFAMSMWCFEVGFVAGFGSRKLELVDKTGDNKSIFYMIRFFRDHLPIEFIPAEYNNRAHSAFSRLSNPATGGSLVGEGGDQIGRGGRTSMYFVDEAAFIDHQAEVDRALSNNTDCKIDISTVNGNGNEFYRKRHGRFNNSRQLFIFDWHDDPRKDQAWYERFKRDNDTVTVAQEVDRDYNASNADSFIPSAWIAAAVDADQVLGFDPTGIRVTGFDPADTGDGKAIGNRHGSVLLEAKLMLDGDITQAIPWAFVHADRHRADAFVFDADGLGATSIRMGLQNLTVGRMRVEPFYGSGAIEDPDALYLEAGENPDRASDGQAKTNAETFVNYRAQAWTMLRDRFRHTFNAVSRAKEGKIVNADPDNLISISSKAEAFSLLVSELSRPKRIWSKNGKIQVESKVQMKARGVESPNLADMCVMCFSRSRPARRQFAAASMPTPPAHDPGTGY